MQLSVTQSDPVVDAGNGNGNVLFNDALNTFYLRLYGVRHLVTTILIVRKETRCRHIGYSFRLTARVLLYAPSHRQDSTYHGLFYTSRGALFGTRNSSMGPPHEGSIRLVDAMIIRVAYVAAAGFLSHYQNGRYQMSSIVMLVWCKVKPCRHFYFLCT